VTRRGRLVFVLILLLFLSVIGWLFNHQLIRPDNGTSEQGQHIEDDHQTPENDRESSVEAPLENGQVESVINQIFQDAAHGMMAGLPFIAGTTSFNEVVEAWGKPDDESTVGQSVYASYADRLVTVGYRNNLVVDIRSYHRILNEIHYEDIRQLKGNANEVRYYKDDQNDQIILVYQTSPKHQLKWILDRPSATHPNPEVHHLSLVYTGPEQVSPAHKGSIEEILDGLSLDEKIGQMVFAGIEGERLTPESKRLINQYKIGGIIFYEGNISTPGQTVSLINQIKTENHNNPLPLFLGIDEEGGRITRLPASVMKHPSNQHIGQVNDGQYAYDLGELLGKKINAFGFNLNFAPVLDVNSNSNNPVIGDRSYGSDPERVSRLGVLTMKGIAAQGVIPVIKHFPGHGDTDVDSHLDLPEVDKTVEQLKALELVPFIEAINHGAEAVMVAHILFPRLDPTYPATMSPAVITDMLRNEFNFQGVVITDDLTMEAITDHYDIGFAAVRSVQAGSDIVLVGHEYDLILRVIKALREAVQSGEIPESRIDESVRRIIDLKDKYKLTHDKVGDVNVDDINQAMSEVLKE
jgi:beta-N-acetylhexosaminidase